MMRPILMLVALLAGWSVPAAAQTQKRIAVVAFNFQNDRSEPKSLAEVRAYVLGRDPAAYSSRNVFWEASYHQLDLVGDVFGYATIPLNADCSTYREWVSAARIAAQAQFGFVPSNYSHVIYYEGSLNCGGGEATIGSSLLAGGFTIATHELGHALGLHHGNARICRENDVYTTNRGTCRSEEYGDRHSFLGGGNAVGALHRYQLGWLTAQTIITSQTVVLKAVERAADGVALVRVPLPGVFEPAYPSGPVQQVYFWLAWHLPETIPTVWNGEGNAPGVLVYRQTASIIGQTQLLDMIPDGDFWNAFLLAGKSYTDQSGLTLRVVRASASERVIAIELPREPAP